MNLSLFFHSYLDPSIPEVETCPGKYCGRLSNTSECGTCPWGFRTSPDPDALSSLCEPCDLPLSLHEWLYLGFVFLLPILFFFFVLPLVTQTPVPDDLSGKKRRPISSSSSPLNSASNSLTQTPSTLPKSKCTSVCLCSKQDRQVWVLGLACILIHALAALVTVVLFPPFGQLSLVHCAIYRLEDFYAPLLAAPGCSYEAVYPLTSLPLVYFGLSAVQSLLFYSILFMFVFTDRNWFNVLYYALYAYPILCVLIAIFGGLLFYVYTYCLLAVALIDSLYRFPLVFDYCSKSADLNLRPVCHPLTPIKAMIINPGRYLLPLILNLVCMSYAILAHWQTINWIMPVVCLGPFVFYLVTLPLSHPLLYYNGQEILNNMRNQDHLMQQQQQQQQHSRTGSLNPTSQVQFRL